MAWSTTSSLFLRPSFQGWWLHFFGKVTTKMCSMLRGGTLHVSRGYVGDFCLCEKLCSFYSVKVVFFSQWFLTCLSLYLIFKAKMFISQLEISPPWCQRQLPAGHLSSLGYFTCIHQLMDIANKLSVVESATTYGCFLLFPHMLLNIDLQTASQN